MVVAIFLIVMGVVLANLPTLREQKLLELVAQEVVTTVRQAQIYGVSRKKADATNYSSYGIYFNQSTNNQFIVFADTFVPLNNVYDLGEAIETYTFPASIQILSVNPNPSSIVYTSPNIDPTISPGAGEVIVVLKSLRTNMQKTIHISGSGMVYAQ